jgi:adenylate cyclase
MPDEMTSEEKWYQMLTEGERVSRRVRHLFGLIPSSPRCKICNSPFKGVGGSIMKVVGREQSPYNPRYCITCEPTEGPGGAEIVLSMLFADVRGSTTLAEKMSPLAFSRLINRFYTEATDVLVRTDALVDRLIGDEVVGLYIPGMAGKEHARRAIEAAQNLLDVTGHRNPDGPWVPVGIGVHTGLAFVGVVGGGEDNPNDFTALGDSVNITARLASHAQPGEILISDEAYKASGFELEGLEFQDLELKGKREAIKVHVQSISPN